MLHTHPPSRPTAPRRLPRQHRARQRVDSLLDSAFRLIAERGIDQVGMRDIARETGVSLSAIYQYFPNKSAIVSALYNRITDQTRTHTTAAPACETPEAYLDMLEGLFDDYYASVRSQPGIADVVSAVQADKALQHLDQEDSQWHTAVLASRAGALIRPGAEADFTRALFLINHLIGGVLRLALTLGGAQANALVTDFKRMARGNLAQFLHQPEAI